MTIKLTRAFCLGEDRQHITALQLVASSKNDLSMSFFSENSKDFPSIIRPYMILLSFVEFIWDIPSLICFLMLSREAYNRKWFRNLLPKEFKKKKKNQCCVLQNLHLCNGRLSIPLIFQGSNVWWIQSDHNLFHIFSK